LNKAIGVLLAACMTLLCACLVDRLELQADPTALFPTPWHEPHGERPTPPGSMGMSGPTMVVAAPQPAGVAPTQSAAPRVSSGKMLAVLSLKSDPSAGLGIEHVAMLTDYVRQLAFKAAGHHEIMTSENMEVLLKSHGTTLAQCAEASCEVEFGQRIGADFVVSGALSKLGSYLFLNLKAHDTSKGVLLSAETVKAKTVDGLVEGLDAAALKLLGHL
jgi:hypothetical protein